MARRRFKISKKQMLSAFLALTICLVSLIVSLVQNNILNQGAKSETDADFVRFLDVGQGDAALVFSNGYTALIDTGTPDSAPELCSELQSLGIKTIDVLLLSHLHDDHTGGVSSIIENFKVSNVVLPELSTESEELGTAQLAINKVTASGGGVYNAKQGMNFEIGDFELTVLAAFGEMSDENNRSIMLVAETHGVKFLFTGDAEKKAEKQLLSEGLNLKCDVFKAGHHGSSTSNCDELLKAVRPRYVAISAGKDNMYGHPHNEILSAFEYIGAEVFNTQNDGDITFYVNKGVLSVKTEVA